MLEAAIQGLLDDGMTIHGARAVMWQFKQRGSLPRARGARLDLLAVEATASLGFVFGKVGSSGAQRSWLVSGTHRYDVRITTIIPLSME